MKDRDLMAPDTEPTKSSPSSCVRPRACRPASREIGRMDRSPTRGSGAIRARKYPRPAERSSSMNDSLTYRPRLLVLAGPNGAGKTMITERGLAHEWFGGCEYVNPDVIAQRRARGNSRLRYKIHPSDHGVSSRPNVRTQPPQRSPSLPGGGVRDLSRAEYRESTPQKMNRRTESFSIPRSVVALERMRAGTAILLEFERALVA